MSNASSPLNVQSNLSYHTTPSEAEQLRTHMGVPHAGFRVGPHPQDFSTSAPYEKITKYNFASKPISEFHAARTALMSATLRGSLVPP